MPRQGFSRVVYFSALYDLIITAPFAFPWSARWLSGVLAQVHESASLSGSAPSLADPFALLFANLMGTIVVIWAVIRLRSPTLESGAFDTLGRVLFSCWMWFAWVSGGSSLLLHFLAAEVLWALVQGLALLRQIGGTTSIGSAECSRPDQVLGREQ